MKAAVRSTKIKDGNGAFMGALDHTMEILGFEKASESSHVRDFNF